MGIICKLKLCITEAVDEGVDLLTGLAVWAIAGVVGLIVREISNAVDGADRIACNFINCTVDSSNTGDSTAVVTDSLDSSLSCEACCNRSHEDNNVLAADHWKNVVAEDDLGVSVELRSYDVAGIVRVDGCETALCESLGNTCAENLCTVKADDGINRSIVDKVANQLLCSFFSIRKTHLLWCNIDIIIDMAVVSSKMTVSYVQWGFAFLNR